MSTYSYTKTPVSVDRLTQEIQQSTIATALDYMTLFGSSLDVLFKAALSDADKAILDALVAAHTGLPLLQNTVTPVSIQTPISISSTPAFASKAFGTKNLFKRVVGKRFDLVVGDNSLIYTETFPWVKFMSLEIINGECGDYCSLYILDTATGAYSTIPNYPLNQFGFEANIGAGFYVQRSEFDADIYAGLQIKVVYHSVSAKTVAINYVMNEVK